MSPFSIKVDGTQHKFSSAHFIAGHEKCGRIHGHNFHVSIDISGPLDARHFVVDFMDVRNALRPEIEKLDHKLLVPGESSEVSIEQQGDNLEIQFSGKHYSIPACDACILPLPAITSELLARYFHVQLASKFPEGLSFSITVGETSSSFATYGEA